MKHAFRLVASTKCKIEDALQKTIATGMFEQMLCEKPDLEQLAKTATASSKDYSYKGYGTYYGKRSGDWQDKGAVTSALWAPGVVYPNVPCSFGRKLGWRREEVEEVREPELPGLAARPLHLWK